MKIIIWTLSVLIFIVVMSVISVGIGNIIFERNVKSEVEKIFDKNNNEKSKIITEKDSEGLPEPVQKWLKNLQITGDNEKVIGWKIEVCATSDKYTGKRRGKNTWTKEY